MSKLVIHTQIHENYGAHAWNGEGKCPQYWKAKGGLIYVVPNLEVNLAIKARDFVKNFDEHISITQNDDYGQEYVIDAIILGDNEPLDIAEWETPIEISLEKLLIPLSVAC